MFRSQLQSLRGAVVPLGTALLIEVALRLWGVHSEALALPSDVLAASWQALADGSFAVATMQTLSTATVALLIGGAIGLAAGTAIGLSTRLRRLTTTSVDLLRPVPSIALVPIAMLVFGLGARMEISVAAYACIWPMLIMSAAAARGIEPRLLEVSRVLGLAPWRRVVSIVLPAMLPRIMVAVRLTSAVALIVAVTVEIAGNPIGLGSMIITAQQSLQPDLMWATLLWIATLGWAVNAALLALNRWLFNAETTGAST